MKNVRPHIALNIQVVLLILHRIDESTETFCNFNARTRVDCRLWFVTHLKINLKNKNE